MKKKVVERTLVVLVACAACVGVTSCGNDSAEQPVPAAPPAAAPTPAAPAANPPAPAPTPATPAANPPAPATPPVAAPKQVPVQSSNPSPSQPQVTEQTLTQMAQQQDARFLTSARAWAGNNLERKLKVCDIAQKAKRANDLVRLAADARDACSGTEATFGNLYRVALFFEAASNFNEAWNVFNKALAQRIPKEREKEALKLGRRLKSRLSPAK